MDGRRGPEGQARASRSAYPRGGRAPGAGGARSDRVGDHQRGCAGAGAGGDAAQPADHGRRGARPARARVPRSAVKAPPGPDASVLCGDFSGRSRLAARTGAGAGASLRRRSPARRGGQRRSPGARALAAVRGARGLAAPPRRSPGGGPHAHVRGHALSAAAALDARAPRTAALGRLATARPTAARAGRAPPGGAGVARPRQRDRRRAVRPRSPQPAVERRGGGRAVVAAVQPDAC